LRLQTYPRNLLPFPHLKVCLVNHFVESWVDYITYNINLQGIVLELPRHHRSAGGFSTSPP
jgi:hypothetical protein